MRVTGGRAVPQEQAVRPPRYLSYDNQQDSEASSNTLQSSSTRLRVILVMAAGKLLYKIIAREVMYKN